MKLGIHEPTTPNYNRMNEPDMVEGTGPSPVHLQLADDPSKTIRKESGELPSDIFNFPAHVRADYEGVVMEPDYFPENHIADKCKVVSKALKTWYDVIHVVVYYFLAVVFGSVLAIIWGICFAATSFCTVWFFQPFIKLWFIGFRCFYVMTRAWTRMILDPCFESIALALGRISGKFTINVNGIHNI